MLTMSSKTVVMRESSEQFSDIEGSEPGILRSDDPTSGQGTARTKQTPEGTHRGVAFPLEVNTLEGKEKDGEFTSDVVYSSLHDSRHDSMVFAHGESGLLGGIVNYTNLIVGSGLIAMPYACK